MRLKVILVMLCGIVISACSIGGKSTDQLNQGIIQSKSILIGAQAVHYYELDSQVRNSAIILLTGVGTKSAFWSQNFVRCLGVNHTVYMLDYPGINSVIEPSKSINIDYLASITNGFTKQLGLNHPKLVGWSMGGSVALEANFESSNNYGNIYLIAGAVPSATNMIYPFPSHPPFTNDDQVFDFVFGNNLYAYIQNRRNYYVNQLIESSIAELFLTPVYTESQLVATESWQLNPVTMDKFQHLQKNITFIIPMDDQVVNESLALQSITGYTGVGKIIKIPASGHDASLQYPSIICHIIN